MPRSKRSVRASGVGRSLGAVRLKTIRCLCCGEWFPREAIAHIGRKPYFLGKKKMPRAFCGECYTSGRVWRDPWKVEEELPDTWKCKHGVVQTATSPASDCSDCMAEADE